MTTVSTAASRRVIKQSFFVMVCPPFCLLFSLAVRAGSIEDRVGCVQRELLALRQVLCKQCGVAVGHVEGFAALHTAHVQRALAALGVKILIKRFVRPAFCAAAHLFLRFQLRKISIHSAETDLLLCQRVRHLACSQQLVRVFP